MYCKHCGKQLPDDAVTCTGCGSPTAPTTVTPQAHTSESPAPQTKTSFINSLGIVGFVLAVYSFVTWVIGMFSYYGTSYTSSIMSATLAAVSLGIICTKHAKGVSRVLAIIGMALAALILTIATILLIVSAAK